MIGSFVFTEHNVVQMISGATELFFDKLNKD